MELVRSAYEFGDVLNPNPEEIDRAFREFLDEQFEMRLPPDYPEGEPIFRGREGVTQLSAMLRATWGEWRFESERFVDAGDRIVVFGQILVEGEASGVPIDFETTHVWTVRGGRAKSLHAYRDRAEALEAAGLRE